MALVEGTNCGFVLAAPTGDPDVLNVNADTFTLAGKYTSPANATKITEIGWYCDNATEAADAEVGIYANDAVDNEPGALIGKAVFAKGTSSGWKKATVDIAISPETIYWLAFQVDDTATTTQGNYVTESGRIGRKENQTTLPEPWGDSNTNWDNRLCVYAVYEKGLNLKINIGDTWKGVDSMKINIGDVWKDVDSIKINVGDTWKTI